MGTALFLNAMDVSAELSADGPAGHLHGTQDGPASCRCAAVRLALPDWPCTGPQPDDCANPGRVATPRKTCPPKLRLGLPGTGSEP